MDIVQTGEVLIRLGVFLLLFAGLASLEYCFPRRRPASVRRRRWPTNISLAAINQLFMRLVLPVSAIALASQLSERNWGLLGIYQWPVWIELVVGILILDLAIYLQHRLFHSVPVLWRLHRMHHADTEFDVSTGVHFSPALCFRFGDDKIRDGCTDWSDSYDSTYIRNTVERNVALQS